MHNFSSLNWPTVDVERLTSWFGQTVWPLVDLVADQVPDRSGEFQSVNFRLGSGRQGDAVLRGTRQTVTERPRKGFRFF